jgi:hypothetical protein
MKERPILFNAGMVRAILDGRKTQTRRIMKLQPSESFSPDVAKWYEPTAIDKNGEMYPGKPIFGVADKYGEDEGYKSPLGQPGDRLWVRETWGVVSHAFDDNGSIIPWTPDRPATPIHEMPFGNGYYTGHIIYRSDGGFTWSANDDGDGERTAWHPSIHMPRKASRIDLLITGVRVERLQSISNIDALAEGCLNSSFMPGGRFPNENFAWRWQSIYGDESWNANPWVWVIEFERVGGAA